MSRNQLQQVATNSPGGFTSGLSASQGIALASLLAGSTHTTAAREAGVNRTTVWRWTRENPEFIAALNSAKREMASSVEQGLLLLSGRAIGTLKRLLSKRSVSDSVKLAAASTVLRLTAGRPDGPTEVEDAKNQVLQERSARKLASMRARIALRDDPFLKQIDSPRPPDDDGNDDL